MLCILFVLLVLVSVRGDVELDRKPTIVIRSKTLMVTEPPTAFRKARKKGWRKYANVFGVHIFAPGKFSNAKVRHVASVLAEQLDQDGDGEVDSKELAEQIARNGACMILPRRNCHGKVDYRTFEDLGLTPQCLGGEEIFFSEQDGRDATFEETHHLIYDTGLVPLFPDVFSSERGSKLSNLMDEARKGHFEKVPKRYPDGAWYTYYDRTCRYDCQVGEFIWWLMSSLVGFNQQSCHPGNDIYEEFRFCTEASMMENLPDFVNQVLRNPTFLLPQTNPQGNYFETAPKCLNVESDDHLGPLCAKYCANEQVMNDLVEAKLCYIEH